MQYRPGPDDEEPAENDEPGYSDDADDDPAAAQPDTYVEYDYE
ncbi:MULTISPECIES: hypothetical protein [unclassified Nocardia]|nr:MULTISPECIES: hypothetical protein [unclassified Nocardia]